MYIYIYPVFETCTYTRSFYSYNAKQLGILNISYRDQSMKYATHSKKNRENKDLKRLCICQYGGLHTHICTTKAWNNSINSQEVFEVFVNFILFPSKDGS